MRSKTLTVIFGLLVGVGAFLVDRLAKRAVVDGLLHPGQVFFPWIQITSHHNFGLLGNLPLPTILILVLSFLALVLLSYGLFDALKQGYKLDFLALSLVLGGALGNLYDRLAYGFVFDWLMFFNTSIINVADAAITLGLAVYIVRHFLVCGLSSPANKKEEVN
ncbi:MAG: signal peptidase II [Patescibacteria group bacterium]|nr:signal peptidase II [Patescibacteria group bacterium]